MPYYRLRDIKAPPFAYVLNKADVVHACKICQMPHQELDGPLQVEICTTDLGNWEARMIGRPMMAEEWLIGDDFFAEKLEHVLPGLFEQIPIQVVSWLARSPLAVMTSPESVQQEMVHRAPPPYYYFKPVHQVRLDHRILESFPPLHCCECHRAIPDIPIDFRPIPDPEQEIYPAAGLKGLYLEGFDYLFSKKAALELEKAFPEMMLEKLVSEPLMI